MMTARSKLISLQLFIAAVSGVAIGPTIAFARDCVTGLLELDSPELARVTGAGSLALQQEFWCGSEAAIYLTDADTGQYEMSYSCDDYSSVKLRLEPQ